MYTKNGPWIDRGKTDYIHFYKSCVLRTLKSLSGSQPFSLQIWIPLWNMPFWCSLNPLKCCQIFYKLFTLCLNPCQTELQKETWTVAKYLQELATLLISPLKHYLLAAPWSQVKWRNFIYKKKCFYRGFYFLWWWRYLIMTKLKYIFRLFNTQICKLYIGLPLL